MEIRRATEDDIDAIDACNRKILAENYERGVYESLMKSESSSIYVLEQTLFANPDQADNNGEKTIVGYIIGAPAENTKKIIVGHIVSIGILPEYRSQGYGTELMKCVEEDAMLIMYGRMRLPYISLNVRKSNKIAQKFYLKLGYGRTKKLKKYYKNPIEDAYLMKKFFS